MSLKLIAAQVNVTVPLTANSAHQVMAAQLSSLSGHAFDTTYINAEIADHIKTIALFQTEIQSGNNTQVQNLAIQYLPEIEMHLQMAQYIQTIL